MKTSLAILSAVAMSLIAQGQPAPQKVQAPATPAGKASIEGTVSDSITHEPVKKAAVELSGRIGLSAVTDGSGRFAFRQLPAGQYTLQANSPNYPQRDLDVGQQLRFSLAAEDQKQDVALLLTPGASVAGRVLDEEGNPMPQCGVSASQFRDTGAGPALENLGFAMSNDKGEYKISGVPSGKYYIQARCNLSVPLPHALIRRGSTADLPMLTYPPQFYPGVRDAQGAPRVEATPGANIASIDIHLSPGTGVAVRGRIVSLPSDRGVLINLEPQDPMRREYMRLGARFNPATGEFRIQTVPPGAYDLVAAGSSEGHWYFARVPVEVGATPPDPIDLTLAPGPLLSGTVSLDDDSAPKTELKNLHVMLNTLERIPLGQRAQDAEVQSDGSFALDSVMPGHWRLSVVGSRGYVKSVARGDQELSAADLEVGPQAAGPLKIVIGTKFGHVDATASLPTGNSPLFGFLWPVKGDAAFQHEFVFDAQGRASTTLPPGEYRGCATAGAPPRLLLQNRALRKALEERCAPVDIPEDGRASVEMPLISAQDLRQLADKLDQP